LRRLMLVFVAVALMGAGADVRSTKLTPALVKDAAQIKKITSQLSPVDRDRFERYILGRALTDQGLAKPALTDKGLKPATVGEALDIIKRADQQPLR
jgi:hypothetical protein